MPVPTVAGLAGETVAPTPPPPTRASAPASSTAQHRIRLGRDNPPPPPPALIVPPPHDFGLETRIKQLRDQQANICTELAQLLPLKYGTDFKLELEMLQHKLLVLEAYAREQNFYGMVPVLSEIEEARALQYQCECIETACIYRGIDLHDPKFVAMLKTIHRDHAPQGYAEWLDRNVAHYDPVFISHRWRLRDSQSLTSPQQLSYKCWDDSCIHYIYGYSQSNDRDRHARDHTLSPTWDSALSVSGTPTPPFSGHQRGPSSHKHSLDYGQQDSSRNPPRTSSSVHQLPPIAPASQPRDTRDSLRTYSFVSECSPKPRSSIDSEVDPLLPPPKRPKHGQPRLKSIEELMLLSDLDQSLRDESRGGKDQEVPEHRILNTKLDYKFPDKRASLHRQQYLPTDTTPSSAAADQASVLPSQTLASQATQAIQNSQTYSQAHAPSVIPPQTLMHHVANSSHGGTHPISPLYRLPLPHPQPWSSRPSISQTPPAQAQSSQQLASGHSNGSSDQHHHHHSMHPHDRSALPNMPGSVFNHRASIGSFEQGPRIDIIPSRSYPVSGGKNECPTCGRAVKDLPSHMLTHQDERPEKCPIATCNFHTKGFARKYDKQRHTLIHYQGTIICPFCPGAGTDFEKSFNRADNFKKHLMKSHGVEQTPPNSRKNVLASGGGTTGHIGANATCSICRGHFATAQAFYEHLDECIVSQVLSTVPRHSTTYAGADHDGGTRRHTVSGAHGELMNSTNTINGRRTTSAHVGGEPDMKQRRPDAVGLEQALVEESHLSGKRTILHSSKEAEATQQHDATGIPVSFHQTREDSVEVLPISDPRPDVKHESQRENNETSQLATQMQPKPGGRKALPSGHGQREETDTNPSIKSPTSPSPVPIAQPASVRHPHDRPVQPSITNLTNPGIAVPPMGSDA